MQSVKGNQWVLDRIAADQIGLHIPKNKLYNVKIGVLDTGLSGTLENVNVILLSALDDPLLHQSFHGVAIAGIIGGQPTSNLEYQGVIPGIPIYAYNVPSDKLDNKQIARGIEILSQAGLDVANISLGSFKPDQEVLTSVTHAIEKGTVIVASSGNSGTTDLNYPASYQVPGFISVGSLDKNNNILPFTTVNDRVDLYVPGQDIYCIESTGSTVGLQQYSGTSVSAPYVTAVVALIRALDPERTPEDIKNLLLDSAEYQTVFWGSQKKTVRVLNVRNALLKMGVEFTNGEN